MMNELLSSVASSILSAVGDGGGPVNPGDEISTLDFVMGNTATPPDGDNVNFVMEVP